jgi:GxxExxY protein
MADIILKDESYKLIGLCMEVHCELGMGFKEVIYQDALDLELKANGVPFKREVTYKVTYKGQILKHHFVADFVVFDSLILELKASVAIAEQYTAQTISYLKASGIKLGIIVNFGESSLKYKRVVF